MTTKGARFLGLAIAAIVTTALTQLTAGAQATPQTSR